MKKTTKDYASRPHVEWGCLIWAIILWLVFFGICIISVLGISRDFSSPLVQFISERGLIPGCLLALAGTFLFSAFQKSR